jgi:hypothetical protein
MSQQLINHSVDLKRLQDEGYEVGINGGYLLLHHVPYVNQQQQIGYGVLVSPMTLSNNVTTRPDNHVVYFAGEQPCDRNGVIISAISHASSTQAMGGIMVHHSFSNKPVSGYSDYYAKMTTYANIISTPAKAIDDTVTERTFKLIEALDEDSVFKYIDTNASRANITAINAKLKSYSIAIIGAGGTGAYILDLVAKTPVSAIHLFDGDILLQHNAFRSPGAVRAEDLSKKLPKAVYYADVYGAIHRHVHAHPYFIQAENIEELSQFSFVFICVDSNRVRRLIMDHLVKAGIPFVDVGLGVNTVDDQLIGMLRVTSGTPKKNDHLDTRISGEDTGDNVYATNIQIADLNALNAALAVIKWKKIAGFYQDLEEEHHSAYAINVSKVFNEDRTA